MYNQLQMVIMRKAITISIPEKDAEYARQHDISPSKIVQKVIDWFRTRDGIAMLRVEDVQRKSQHVRLNPDGSLQREPIPK
jgi:hypothetical protein